MCALPLEFQLALLPPPPCAAWLFHFSHYLWCQWRPVRLSASRSGCTHCHTSGRCPAGDTDTGNGPIISVSINCRQYSGHCQLFALVSALGLVSIYLSLYEVKQKTKSIYAQNKTRIWNKQASAGFYFFFFYFSKKKITKVLSDFWMFYWSSYLFYTWPLLIINIYLWQLWYCMLSIDSVAEFPLRVALLM